ncbi:MAG: ribosomal protein S18-alanine N-acetyltransferase [Candidatus Bathyarchaeia archaeon]
MEPVVIRPVAAGDLRQVLEIERLSFKRPYPSSYIDTLAYLSPDTFLVAEADRRVVGYAVFSMRGRTAHILSLAVHPEWRRKGIGLALLKNVVCSARRSKASSIRLEVRESNLVAQRLYAQAGFSESGRIRAYYEDGEDAVVMELTLSNSLNAAAGADRDL